VIFFVRDRIFRASLLPIYVK